MDAKRMTAMTTALCLTILWILSCPFFPLTGASAEAGEKAKLTLMIYMVGSNLETDYGAASRTIDRIAEAAANGPEINLLMMTGGSKSSLKWNAGKSHIWEVRSHRSRTLWNEELMNMGEPETLSFFLNYCAENRPAERYALILWGHGNGPLGFGYDELFEMGYEAVFIGSGAGLPRFMGIDGEGLIGVYSANEYLTRINLMKAYRKEYATPIMKSQKVAVVGGGNVAMDAARSALRIGAKKVYVVYRRSLEELPARKEEVHHAMEEGVEFLTLNNPVELLGDDNGRVRAMVCRKMELGEPDESGRRSPVAIEGSDYELDVDTVIMAIGTSPNPLIRNTTPGLDVNKRGCLIVDDTEATTKKGVYAGGDAVTGAATVILAMGAGKKAAAAIDAYIKNINEEE